MNLYDSFFEIIENSDGVYVKIYPASNGGKKVILSEVVDELDKRCIKDYDCNYIEEQLIDVESEKMFKVVGDISDENSTDKKLYTLIISDNRLCVYIAFYTTDSSLLSKDSIIEDIRQRDIKATINEEYISEILTNIEEGYRYEIAKGKEPVDGRPAEINYFFKTKKDLKPEVDEDGNVNFHKLHLLCNVKKGQKLAELIPETEGVDGMDVFGNVIKAKISKPVRLQGGKNTKLNQDKTLLTAEEDGLVRVDNGKIVVNSIFEIPNNVGNSTGDIEFNGTVIVHGNIQTGFKVIAKGDVEVIGVIEGAIVEAGGSITAHRGIQGLGNCRVVAKGDVQARYIENANVISGGNIHSEAILHSNVSARDEIVVDGKKGMISGGSVRSTNYVEAITLGSHMGTTTNIDVGIDPIVWKEYDELKKTLPTLKDELSKLDQVITLLNKKKEIDGELDQQKQEMYVSATRNKIFLANKVNISEKKFADLSERVSSRNNGIVTVKGTMYPGTVVTIGELKHTVRDAIKSVQLKKVGADIRLNALD